MERRRNPARGGSPGGLAGGVSAPAQPKASSAGWLHIQALIEGGGQTMIGTVAPIRGAAVAHDGKKTLAMLRCRPGEAVPELLAESKQDSFSRDIGLHDFTAGRLMNLNMCGLSACGRWPVADCCANVTDVPADVEGRGRRLGRGECGEAIGE